jgi:hypothetical protein
MSCSPLTRADGAAAVAIGARRPADRLEGLQRIVKARTVHGGYGAEMRELRGLMRALYEEQLRLIELVK